MYVPYKRCKCHQPINEIFNEGHYTCIHAIQGVQMPHPLNETLQILQCNTWRRHKFTCTMYNIHYRYDTQYLWSVWYLSVHYFTVDSQQYT